MSIEATPTSPARYLMIRTGKFRGYRFALDADEVVIGRDPACTMKLPDGKLSRRHARVFRSEDGFYAEDLGSRNGTFLNNAKLEVPVRLAEGDEITVGLTRIKFGGESATDPRQVSSTDVLHLDDREAVRRDEERRAGTGVVEGTHDSLAARRIGGYRIEYRIGAGGMGRIYRAKHETLNRDVALKILHPELAGDQAMVTRFLREARAAGRLSHPGIVQVFDSGEVDGVYYIAMEYVEGEPLQELVDTRGPLPPADVCAIGMQVLDALSHAHRMGILHRDVKPGNMLLTPTRQVKLLDLGLARVSGNESSAGNVTQTGQAVGTLYYMSPEQFEQKYVPDQRSDLYAVGASLYHLVAGRPPFAGGSLIEAVRMIRGGQPEPLEYAAPGCPRTLSDVIERAMSKLPELRYPDAMTMQIALSRVQREIQLASQAQGRP